MVGLFDEPARRKLAAWQKASPVIGYDPSQVRRDALGWYIVWSEYGNRKSDYGWEIDHHIPTILGGGDGVANLRALHWRNNASMGGLLRGA
ncbi:MAG: HNH endonuclease signature motif containing protein [Haliea sp.]